MQNIVVNAVRASEDVQTALALHKKNKGVNLTGLANSVKSVFSVALAQGLNACGKVFCVATRDEIKSYRAELEYLFPKETIVELYPRDLLKVRSESQSLEVATARASAFRIMRGEAAGVIFVTAEALLQRQSNMQSEAVPLQLAVGDNHDQTVLIEKLAKVGYERTDQVESVGQFAVRGAILDVFPLGSDAPLRLEWFDTEIESMRTFSLTDQRSKKLLQKVSISPIHVEEGEKTATIFDCCAKNTLIFFDEPSRIWEMLERLAKENLNYEQEIFRPEELESAANKLTAISFSALGHTHFRSYEQRSVSVRNGTSYNHNLNLLQEDLASYLSDGKTPLIMLANTMKARAFADNLNANSLSAVYSDEKITNGKINLLTGNLEHGFRFWNESWVLIAENDIFGLKKRKSPYAKKMGEQVRYFSDIKAGDYVVHAIHGIGRYEGVQNMVQNGIHTDYLTICYADDGRLYVPVDQVGLLHKYVGNEDSTPRLSKMGGEDWKKTKSKAAKAITILAEELLRLYAQRTVAAGHAFAADTNFQKEFEAGFPFEETPDQLQAIADIKKDMESSRPMERLLCGDVGYGKTEVALRAAFKAVMDGKQVAVLVPTTVLAQQHHLTFTQRMRGFGPNVALLNRFTPVKQQKQILADLAKGDVDIVIGTHRLLQSDVIFHDLGLLIIDEEQRFGVGQKEKIKKWRTGIDVLSLSATPIPRTLHLALVNGRDMSVIETPPEDRLPVETFVAEYDDNMVKEAIERELRRGGQIFYIHNRIENLPAIELRLHRLVPGMRIVIGHGRMPQGQLEEAMMDFYNGECDLLLCTTIVENGLDVPKANTMIVDGADHYGLSQLYQMRGRVGRSSRLAYAYLLYRKNKVLSEVASKRLQAIRDFTELGAGFKIAMRDLEIRGAGNILGAEQHGHIAGVGFHEYCTMLEQTIRRLKTGQEAENAEPQPVLEIPVDAYISDDYIEQPRFKMEVYRHLAELEYAEKDEYLQELEDRFGKPPEEVITLWRVACLRALCRNLKIRGIHVHTGEIRIVFAHQSLVNPQELVSLISAHKNKMRFIQSHEPVLLYRDRDVDIHALQWLEETLPKLV